MVITACSHASVQMKIMSVMQLRDVFVVEIMEGKIVKKKFFLKLKVKNSLICFVDVFLV